MKIVNFTLGLLLMLSLPVAATTLVTVKFNEVILPHKEASGFGIKSEVLDVLDKSKLYEFRVAVPENINGNKINHVTAEIFNSEQNIASFSMGHYSSEKNRYSVP